MKVIESVFIKLVRIYQFFSAFLPRTCRFYPTCSQYMIESIEKLGLVKGLFRGMSRIIKCHPLNPGGYDPV